MNKKEVNIIIPYQLFNDIEKYCKVNEIGELNEFIVKMVRNEFNREKYGEIGNNNITLTDDIKNLLHDINQKLMWVKNKLNIDEIQIHQEVNEVINTVQDIIPEIKVEPTVKVVEKVRNDDVSDTDYDNIKLITKKKSRRLR